MRERLGAGAAGETWRAHDTLGGREVVLKLSTDGQVVQSVTDYVEGSDLSVLRGQDWRRIASAVADVADALAVLHARGSVHRDVKSSNAILKPDGSAALIDALPEGASELSPYSASPQQYRGEPPSPADDAYALGVLLYELLSGYPPFFPNVTRERVLDEQPAPLKSVHPIPPELQDLTVRLMAKDADKRPKDMKEVARSLRGFAKEPESIIRPILRTAADPSAARRGAAGGRSRNVFVGLGLVVLLVVAAGVFVLLPKYVTPPEAKLPPPPPKAATPEPVPEPPKEVDYMALAQAMDKAEQVRGAYESLFSAYEKQGAAQWAAELFSSARMHGETGLAHFRKREYVESEESYKEGLNALQQIADIGKKNEEIARQARAREAAEKAAAEAAEKARVAADQFAASMSQGMKLFNAGKFAEARASFDRAGKLKPGANEVTSALAQVTQAEQRVQIANARKQAEAFEAKEQWSDALAQYEAALKVDPSVEFALTGRDRVRPRIDLNDRLQQLVSRPDRLLSASVRTQTAELLKIAGQVSSPGPVLSQQVAQVSELLKQAQTPVTVKLESDGTTDVAINRTNRLGAFAQREVQLLPGNYTVMGTRAGYRDVRRELVVAPGKTPATLIVRCEEPI